MKGTLIIVLVLVLLGAAWYFVVGPYYGGSEREVSGESQALLIYGLTTDASNAEVDLKLLLSGGPGKDGIPAIDEPLFVPIQEARVGDETQGILVTVDGEKRYYPYNILSWHEIVNDSIGNTYFAVTFCPLCGSAIVFDREVQGAILSFGVSGLLYESNLVMYDRQTESLWSQAGTRAIVGEYVGTKLDVLDMRIISFAKLKESNPDALVLSRETGFARSYDIDPYAGYGLTDDLFFPVSVNDARLPPKTLMYVIPLGGTSVAFQEHMLGDEARTIIHGVTLHAMRGNGIRVTANGVPAPGYYEMWFSWATHHQHDGALWTIDVTD